MLAKRIIPCLDVKDGKVVKGVQFQNHEIVGDIVELAEYYSIAGADELVFYDITASSDDRRVDTAWISAVARVISIPFCVAGGLRKIADIEAVLNAGADKISMNSPALESPNLINQAAEIFGQQCIVIGIDSFQQDQTYFVYQYTGDPNRSRSTHRNTLEWVREAQERGAGEIVLNCMNQDGIRCGYDLTQLKAVRNACRIPLIASGGAGSTDDFLAVFREAKVDGALAASVFHKGILTIHDVKTLLSSNQIEVRPC